MQSAVNFVQTLVEAPKIFFQQFDSTHGGIEVVRVVVYTTVVYVRRSDCCFLRRYSVAVYTVAYVNVYQHRAYQHFISIE